MTRLETLEQSIERVCGGEKEHEYGSAEDNFSEISKLWSIYKDIEFTPNDVAMMMALLKIARIKTGVGTDDSYIDLAGYAACGAEINSKKENEIKHKDYYEYKKGHKNYYENK